MKLKSLKRKNRKFNKATGNQGEAMRNSAIYYAWVPLPGVDVGYYAPRRPDKYKNSKHLNSKKLPLSRWA